MSSPEVHQSQMLSCSLHTLHVGILSPLLQAPNMRVRVPGSKSATLTNLSNSERVRKAVSEANAKYGNDAMHLVAATAGSSM